MHLCGVAFLFCLLLLAWSTPPGLAQNKCTNLWKNGKRTVECKSLGLKEIPNDIDGETQVLDASYNMLQQLGSQTFAKVRLTNLQRLYLRSCEIRTIDEKALYGLANLVELDLSQNHLTSIPSNSFHDTPFLRDLILSHNPLGKVPSLAFEESPNLIKLDLSYCQLKELADNSLQGLKMLENLKLNNNLLSALKSSSIENLVKLRSIELHENPWKCDCQMRTVKEFLQKRKLPLVIAPICHEPEAVANRSFSEMGLDDFACPPILQIESRYAEAMIGENASITCIVSSVPPAKIKWIWNGKVYTNHSAVNSYQKILIEEKGTYRKESTLVLTNAQETDSSNFFCVAENPAGSVEANFTLHVSLRTAGMSTLGSGQIAGISAALVVLILLILLTIMVLFARLRRIPQKDVKTPAPNSDNVPLDGCNSSSNQDSNNPQSATSTVSRRKVEDVETTSFNESKSIGLPNSLANHNSYTLQRSNANLLPTENHDYLINRGYEEAATRIQQSLMAGPCYSSQSSLMPVDNPDLIRDTRRGSNDEAALPIGYATSGEYSRVLDMDEGKLLYSECLSWEAQGRDLICRPSISANPYLPKDQMNHVGIPVQQQPPPPQQHFQQQQQQQQQQESFPPGAKQIRVWQKGVPVLPPVSALKRVLGSTRSSPDEGYQEGTGTDV